MKMIFEVNKYNDEKSFKMTILKMKGQTSLCCENQWRNTTKKAKSKIKRKSEIKKYMDKRFLPSSYKQRLYLMITSLT